MSDLPQLSAAQWYAAVSKALEGNDVKAAADLIGLMALQHPHEADELRLFILLVTEDDTLTSAHLLAAAAIVAAEAGERGMRHWTDLADRLTREAALRAMLREDEDDD